MKYISSSAGNILFWSVISAAFIGPGTVTTAASAGASYGLSLLWGLLFATLACIVLQEKAARLTLAGEKNLGQILLHQFGGFFMARLVAVAIVMGCAAYQAGNILGAVSGLQLLWDIPSPVAALLVAAAGSLFLWQGTPQTVAKSMGVAVALMGLMFGRLAWKTSHGIGEWLQGLFVPQLPEGSLLLLTGLLGTTIVPYNLFLASGIGQGQSIAEMRRGISVAVLLGGAVSVTILAAGTFLKEPFQFAAFANAIRTNTGTAGVWLFATGLFAAGFSSSVTAPLAAAVTIQSTSKNTFSPNSFRLIWGGVMLFGLIFGLLGIKPVPVILAAQVANGMLLPFMAAILLLAVNNSRLLPKAHCNGVWGNLAGSGVLWVCTLLGMQNLVKAAQTIFLWEIAPDKSWMLSAAVSSLSVAVVAWQIRRHRND
ncbi:Nramp family divalent metal transporter [Rhodoflexus caldus]|uniref:Nramp family divalent metal transporter n=1 Tax=Rhodoflexus caldus TaxID=2891236 RepID=UPI002029CD6B|nr:Nramp family divalent metal transporter [Rhodoflexus caldus]